MFDLILENMNGDQLTFGQQSPFTVTEIQGLNPTPAFIYTNEVALLDGAMFNNSKLDVRQINIAFAIETDPARNRLEVYKVLKPKQYIKVIYLGDYRKVYAEGYISAVDITFWEMKQTVTVSITCPDPYLHAVAQNSNALAALQDMFSFPFYGTATRNIAFGVYLSDTATFIENDGDVDCGMIFDLIATAAYGMPSIYNDDTGEYLTINYSMEAGDEIIIDTRKGHKSVTLIKNAVETNIINYFAQGSTWLQLPADGASFSYSTSGGNNAQLEISIQHDDLYEGV